MFSIVPFIFVDDFHIATSEKMPSFIPGLFFLTITLFVLFLRIILPKFQKENKKIPTWAQYINIFIETSIPTFAIYLSSIFRDSGTVALHIPRNYVYFVFIIFSGLRLNRNLCIFTGFVSFVQYLIIYKIIMLSKTVHIVFEKNILSLEM